MHCVSCALNIDGALEDTPGVTDARTNFAKAVTEVNFDNSKIDAGQIKTVITNSGYKADVIES